MHICGVDEAGRGPLAGPVVAAAVILPSNFPIDSLKDSKQLTPIIRQKLSSLIRKEALDYSIGWVWPEEIDKLNIHVATLLAMKRAIQGLNLTPDKILIDGKYAPVLCIDNLTQIETKIKGDTYISQIQAASILAKTIRDKWMSLYSHIEPNYKFEKHKGYPTKEHRGLIREYGLSPIHRKSFRVIFPE